MLIYREFEGPNIVIMLGCSSYNSTGNIIGDYNITLGEDGYHTQWKDLAIHPFKDYFGQILSASIVRLGPISSGYAFGVSQIDRRADTVVDTFISTKKYKDSIDTQPTNLFGLIRGLLEPLTSPRYERDKISTHFNAEGIIYPKYQPAADPFYFQDTLTSLDIECQRYDLSHYPTGYAFEYGYSNVDGVFNENFVTPVSGNEYGNNVDFILTTNDWIKRPPSISYVENANRLSQLTFLGGSISVIDDKVTFDYKFSHDETSFGVGPSAYIRWHSQWQCRIEVGFSRVSHPNDSSGGAKSLSGFSSYQKYNYSLVEGVCESGSPTTNNYRFTRFTPYSGRLRVTTYPRHFWYGGVQQIEKVDSPLELIRAEIDRHGEYWRSRIKHLIPSNIYSFGSATTSRIEQLNTNMLELFSELSGILDTFPDVGTLLKALALLRRLDPKGLIMLGDFISGNHLRYAFGLKPNLQAVEELNQKSGYLRDLFESDIIPSIETHYGAFFYQFKPEETKFKGAVLQTVSTVDLMFSETSFTRVITALYGLHIGLSPSDWWAILPFSFAADWWFNMSSRLKAIDNIALSCMARIFGLSHSYTVISPGSSSKKLSAVFNTDDMVFKFYRRDVTKHLPTFLLESPIDFKSAGGPPSAILASLVYQLGT